MDSTFLTAAPSDLQKAAELLRAGEIVAIPTETVYGLAAHALNPHAVERIFAAKNRPYADPLIVHIPDVEALDTVAWANSAALKLAQRFWPGALTLVLPKKPVVPDTVTAGGPSVAVRCPGHPVAHQLLQACGFPLAAPSANPFGYISPTLPQHVRDSLGGACPYIIDGGPCRHGVESSIIDLCDPGQPTLLRPGPIPPLEIEDVLGLPLSQPAGFPEQRGQPLPQVAPGMLSRHYSPRTPLFLLAKGQTPPPPQGPGKRAWVHLCRPVGYVDTHACDILWLADRDNLKEAARNVFAMLRRLDRSGYSSIFVETPPPEGIGLALRDRLQRAASRG